MLHRHSVAFSRPRQHLAEASMPAVNGIVFASVLLFSGTLPSFCFASANDESPVLHNAQLADGAAAAREPAEAEYPFDGLIDLQGSRLESSPAVGAGQWTLVMIWATDCHICKQQKPAISAFHDAHKDHDARVFGIALDGQQGLRDVNDYLQEHLVSFPNYIGNYSSIADSYQNLTEESLIGTPTYLLFNPEGELKGNNPGPVGIPAIEAFIARHSG